MLAALESLSRFAHLSLDHDPFTLSGQSLMLFGPLAVGILLTVTKRWKWLWREWLTTVDPKRIGVMYITVALLMLLRGAVDAMMIRMQQATAVGDSPGILSSDTFQQVFTAHGTIMIFFAAMGLMFGLINWIVRRWSRLNQSLAFGRRGVRGHRLAGLSAALRNSL